MMWLLRRLNDRGRIDFAQARRELGVGRTTIVRDFAQLENALREIRKAA